MAVAGRERGAARVAPASPAFQAFQVLHWGFTAAPIIAGLDKFFNLLATEAEGWAHYLAPVFPTAIGVTPETFMRGVGLVEIVAGLLVALWPRVGGYVVMLWLWGIIANLLVLGEYFDIALRDFGLSLGALALARLATEFRR